MNILLKYSHLLRSGRNRLFSLTKQSYGKFAASAVDFDDNNNQHGHQQNHQQSFSQSYSRNRYYRDRYYRPNYRNRYLKKQYFRPRPSKTNGFVTEEKWQSSGTADAVKSVVFEEGEMKTTSSSGIDVESVYSEIPTKLSGNGSDDIKPLFSFKDLTDIDARLLRNIYRMDYGVTTPVQKLAIPAVLAQRDLLALAQTGSGKTAAYLIPLLQRLLGNYPADAMKLTQESRGEKQYPSALVVAPTRELTQQITQEAYKLSRGTPFRTVSLYGGQSKNVQLNRLMSGAHLVVATPGRLTDLLQNDYLSLQCCNALVLDEADRCFDMGFEPQIRFLVENEEFQMPETADGRQTLLFSATFPREIENLASDFMQREYLRLVVGELGEVPKNITQEFIRVENYKDKFLALKELLTEQTGRVLVFSQTKALCDRLEFILRNDGVSCMAIHGDKSQRDRDQALGRFRTGQVSVLLATDVAARGLDIPEVQLVLNFDVPQTVEQYTHRVGRTGRLGQKGNAKTFVCLHNPAEANNIDNVKQELTKLLRDANQEVPDYMKGRRRLSKSMGRPSQRFRRQRRYDRNPYQSRSGRPYQFERHDDYQFDRNETDFHPRDRRPYQFNRQGGQFQRSDRGYQDDFSNTDRPRFGRTPEEYKDFIGEEDDFHHSRHPTRINRPQFRQQSDSGLQNRRARSPVFDDFEDFELEKK